MKKVILVGSVNQGKIVIGGQEAKNQIMVEYLNDKCQLTVFDTKNWRKKPVLLVKLLFTLFAKQDLILLHMASISAYKLIRIIKFLGKSDKCFYMVVGGWFPTMLALNPQRVKTYSGLKGISVEGKKMVDALNKFGLEKIFYHPHFKNFEQDLLSIPIGIHKDNELKFLYLSRIDKEKGAGIVLDAFRKIVENNPEKSIHLEFYGAIRPDYKKEFLHTITALPNVHYNGLIDMRNMDSYRILMKNNYLAFLFPSTYIGEGFPGALIDSMILGIPVIASDWSLNAEVINDTKTGSIVPLDSLERFHEWMQWFINNPVKANEMGNENRRRAKLFHIETVMGEIWSKIIA